MHAIKPHQCEHVQSDLFSSLLDQEREGRMGGCRGGGGRDKAGLVPVAQCSSLLSLTCPMPAWGRVSRAALPRTEVEQPTRRVPLLLFFCFHSTLGFMLCNH